MHPEQARQQAEALDDFLRRGGSPGAWFRSKGFSNSERGAILRARAKLLRATEPPPAPPARAPRTRRPQRLAQVMEQQSLFEDPQRPAG